MPLSQAERAKLLAVANQPRFAAVPPARYSADGCMTEAPAGVSARTLGAVRLWVRKECLIKLGRLSLDTLASCDLASLGVEVPAESATTRSAYAEPFIMG